MRSGSCRNRLEVWHGEGSLDEDFHDRRTYLFTSQLYINIGTIGRADGYHRLFRYPFPVGGERKLGRLDIIRSLVSILKKANMKFMHCIQQIP